MMEKYAETNYPILDVLKRRWSPCAFSDRLIEPYKICCLFEALRWAASSFNEQPWSFIVATKDKADEFSKALNCLVEANQVWAAKVPMLVLTIAKKTFTANNKPNRVYIHDLGLAMGNFCIQATSMNLFVHQMAGIDVNRIRELYEIPTDYEPVTAAAVGYGGEPGQIPQNIRERDFTTRTRKPLNEFIFSNQWGQPSEIL